MSPNERAIRELVDTWMKASRAGDTDRVLDLMSEDAIFMVPGREPFGKQTFAANSRSMDGVKLGRPPGFMKVHSTASSGR